MQRCTGCPRLPRKYLTIMKTTRHFFVSLSLLGLLLFAATGCEAIRCEPEQAFVYAETQCADPWMEYVASEDYPTYEAAVTAYLKQEEGVRVLSIERSPIPDEEIAFCMACTCPNGRSLTVIAEPRFADELEALGFRAQ
jgi:hypothetical protein